jgi:hypothetical protein
MFDPSPATLASSHSVICVENPMSHRRDGDMLVSKGTQPASLIRTAFGDASTLPILKGPLRNKTHAPKIIDEHQPHTSDSAALVRNANGKVEVVNGPATALHAARNADKDKSLDGINAFPRFNMRDPIKPVHDRIID